MYWYHGVIAISTREGRFPKHLVEKWQRRLPLPTTRDRRLEQQQYLSDSISAKQSRSAASSPVAASHSGEEQQLSNFGYTIFKTGPAIAAARLATMGTTTRSSVSPLGVDTYG